MSVFEYLSIAASIVLALGLGRLIAAIPHVLARDKFDWIFALLFLFQVAGALLQWWSIWPISGHERWNYAEFALLMFSPIMLYLAIRILVSETPGAVVSWRQHLDAIHRWYFLSVLILLLASALRNMYFLDGSPGLMFLVMGSALFVAAIWKNRIVFAAAGFTALGATLISAMGDQFGP